MLKSRFVYVIVVLIIETVTPKSHKCTKQWTTLKAEHAHLLYSLVPSF